VNRRWWSGAIADGLRIPAGRRWRLPFNIHVYIIQSSSIIAFGCFARRTEKERRQTTASVTITIDEKAIRGYESCDKGEQPGNRSQQMHIECITDSLLIRSDHSLHKSIVHSIRRQEENPIGDDGEQQRDEQGDRVAERRRWEARRTDTGAKRQKGQKLAANDEEEEGLMPCPEFVMFSFTGRTIHIDIVQRVIDDQFGTRVEFVHTMQWGFIIKVTHGQHMLLSSNTIPP